MANNNLQQSALLTMMCALLSGCASRVRNELSDERERIKRGKYLLATEEAEVGAYYQMKIYVIRHGDSLASIARRSNVSFKQLLALNPGVDVNRLVVGQRIRVSEEKADLPTQTSP